MDKYIIEVPKGIRYMSDWEEFNFPDGQHIMDKQIPGCGFTEYCIRNSEDTVICSPRNMLILNKWEQHPEEVFRVHNDLYDLDLCVDKDISDERVSKAESDSINKFMAALEKELAKGDRNFTDKLERDLKTYIRDMKSKGLPCKILVTYDSFRILKDVLGKLGILGNYRIIIDEFQSVFTDSRFKSSTEMEFISQLRDLDKVCYLSATPMMDKYLEMIPEFRDLPFYELDWETLDPRRVRKPDLKVRIVKSIYEPAKRIIDAYKKGNFDTKTVIGDDGNIGFVESREAMIFVNSVNNIIGIIKRCGLSPEECNILCSNTPVNQEKIDKSIGREYRIGRVPLKGDQRKMFTFCTRTVYLGADFYSDNARTFVLSDSNIDCLAVDISLDLPQILGRQRLEENPWKNSAEFYYKSLISKNRAKLDPAEFDKIVREKEEKSLRKIENYDAAPNKMDLVDDYDKITKYENYRDDYICINTHAGSHPIPEINRLVMVAEKRSFDIQQIDYADRFSVFDAISNATYRGSDGVSQEASDFLMRYNSGNLGIADRLRLICEAGLSKDAYNEVALRVDETTRQYLVLGPTRLRSLAYNVTNIKRELGILSVGVEEMAKYVYEVFSVGDTIERTEIKNRLAEIYKERGYKRTPKATDIGDWFEVNPIQYRENGKKRHGFEFLKPRFSTN